MFSDPSRGSSLPSFNRANLTEKQSQVCEVANKEIQETLDKETTTVLRDEKRKRGEYTKFTTTEQSDIVRYPIQHGNMADTRHFDKIYGCPVSESTIRGYVKKLKNELKSTKNIDDVFELPPAKRGRPLLLGEDLDNHMIHNIKSLHDSALGIVKNQDHTQLKEYGSPIDISDSLAKSILKRMGFVKRKGTKASKTLPSNFKNIKDDFLDRVQTIVEKHKILPSMIVNFDQTGLTIIPVKEWTMEQQVNQTATVQSAPKSQGLEFFYIPASYRSELQLLDISGNHFFKQQLKEKFILWYADEVTSQLNSGKSADNVNVDLKFSIVKPLHAKWVLSSFNCISKHKIFC
uniref:DDE-1 domain-containing protein n=1 Tax=Octopus bimaculoides TaxID=37653 RepID=A0A0L8GP41_OCTBM